jgi:hypothetical protein
MCQRSESGVGREKGLDTLDSYLQTKNIAIGLEEDADAFLEHNDLWDNISPSDTTTNSVRLFRSLSGRY